MFRQRYHWSSISSSLSRRVNDQEPRQWLNIYTGHLTLYISNGLCGTGLWRSSSSYASSKTLHPSSAPLCPDLHSTHGNCNPLDTAHIFSSSPCNGVVCIFKQYGAGAATSLEKKKINKKKMAYYTHKTGNFPSWILSIYEQTFIQQRTTALAAVVGEKLRSPLRLRSKPWIIQRLWDSLCQPALPRERNLFFFLFSSILICWKA